MLNVNEETVRRWIRDGKLHAKRAVGRGGNTLLLEDVIDFANQPPRSYLLSLEAWLTENGIAYKKVEDSSAKKDSSGGAAAIGAGVASAVAGAGIASTASTSLASAALAAGPIGLGVVGVAGIAYGAAKLTKRKNYQKYSIQLIPADKADGQNSDDLNQQDLAGASNQNMSQAQDVAAKESLSDIDDNDQTKTPVAPPPLSVLNEIACAKQLLDSGVITAEEFADIKARLIARI